MDFSNADPNIPAEQGAQMLDNAKQLDGVKGAQYKVPGTSMLPFLLSGASSLIGDIAQMRNLRKMPKNINLGRMTASKIDLEPQRQMLTRQRGDRERTNIAQAKMSGLQGANAYANMVAANTGLQDQYGSAMNQSYMQEQNTNAGLAQQANQVNTQLFS